MSIVGRAATPLGSFKAWITVNANRSATFSISPAAKKIVSSTSTQVVYLVDEAGSYTVSATDGTFSKSSTVSITAKKQSKTVTLNLFDIAITVIAGGSTFSIARSDTSKSSSGKYAYTRSGENWMLTLYASGSVKFSTLQTNVDYCVVGGGGGGGGGSSGGSGYYSCHGQDGGRGGGGTVNTQSNKSLTQGTTYTTTIGTGGSGGLNGDNGSSKPGDSGKAGGASSFNSTTGSGGAGGEGGWDANSHQGADGNTNSATTVFGVSVGGAGTPANRGGGGSRGVWTRANDPYASPGGAGTAGIIMIRNKR